MLAEAVSQGQNPSALYPADTEYKELNPVVKLSGSKLQDIHSNEVNKASDSRPGSSHRKFSYFFASTLHFVAALTKFSGMKDEWQKKLNDFSLGLSKLVHTLAYGYLSYEAFKDHRVLDAVSKILDPLISNFSAIDDINLARGIGGGLNTIDFAQTSWVNKTNGKHDNLRTSLSAAVKMAKEIYAGDLFAKDRKVFNSPSQEKGHSLAFAGHLILVSSALGLLFKPFDKVMNVFRNIGAVIANTVTMYHPDNQKKLSGSLFNVYAALDAVQKFLPKQIAEPINNINMGLYNVAVYYYGDLSHKRTKNTFEHYS